MRAILVLLALLSLSAPAATADPVGCDVDDDLYNHCHAGPVHWVTGPWCAGVKLGAPADCRDLRDLLA